MTTWGRAFASPPEQWGLRGDPSVWEEMHRRLRDAPVAVDPDQAGRQLRECFEAVTGVRLDNPDLDESVYRAEFARGGMSSGQVHIPTWRNRLLPLLLERVIGPAHRR
jgi:hypothetical protein